MMSKEEFWEEAPDPRKWLFPSAHTTIGTKASASAFPRTGISANLVILGIDNLMYCRTARYRISK
jgi:hypothetical protein